MVEYISLVYICNRADEMERRMKLYEKEWLIVFNSDDCQYCVLDNCMELINTKCTYDNCPRELDKVMP